MMSVSRHGAREKWEQENDTILSRPTEESVYKINFLFPVPPRSALSFIPPSVPRNLYAGSRSPSTSLRPIGNPIIVQKGRRSVPHLSGVQSGKALATRSGASFSFGSCSNQIGDFFVSRVTQQLCATAWLQERK